MKFCTLVILILGIVSSMAVQAKRAERWDMSIQMLGNFSEKSNGSNGSSVDIDSAVGMAFGGSYHVNEHLQFGADLSFFYPDYKATINVEGGGQQTVDSELDVFNGHLFGAWNFLPGPLTPYVRGGLGWTYIDSNIATSDVPSGVCWWDPWYGYICSQYYDTYDDTFFTYGMGAGLRYDIGEQLFVSGGFDHYELVGDGLGSSPDFDLWRIEFGWRLPSW
ncbi:outer membrane protein [Marinobacter sp. 1Y8]